MSALVLLQTVLLILPLFLDGAYAKSLERFFWKHGKCYARQSGLEVPFSKCRTSLIVGVCIGVGVLLAVILLVVRGRMRRRRVQITEEVAAVDTPPRTSTDKPMDPPDPSQNPEYAWLAPRTEGESPSVSMPVPTVPPPAKLSTKE